MLVQWAMKINGRTLNHATLEQIRLMAIRRVREGRDPDVVIASYGFNRTTIYKWMRMSAGSGNGLRALSSTRGTGRPRSLTAAQERCSRRRISRCRARQGKCLIHPGIGRDLSRRSLAQRQSQGDDRQRPDPASRRLTADRLRSHWIHARHTRNIPLPYSPAPD